MNILFFSVSETFPTVSLNFAGGASMILKPEEYLLQQNSVVSLFLIYYNCQGVHLDKFYFSHKLWLISVGDVL